MNSRHEQLRRTRIIATLGPATDKPGVLARVLEAGADVVRLNLSHGTAEDHELRCRQVREIAEQMGREVAVLADLQGPKIRIESFETGSVDLEPGAPFTLDCEDHPAPGNQYRVGVTYRGLFGDVAAGDTLLLDDGLISLQVDEVDGKEIRTHVVNGGILRNRKGINRLGGGLSLKALSAKDKSDIVLAAKMEVDYLAVSFPRDAEDMREARALLRASGSSAGLIAKIERAEAITNLIEIADASEALLVARGDLGVEIGYAELPGLQKKIIRESLARNRVVITATQMLQSMVEAPIPTRAEVLDVANSVIDGTDAVMLSEETAAGRHPDKAVAAMREICLAAERQFDAVGLPPGNLLERTDQAIALAAMYLANQTGVRAIIALTESGATAQWLSRGRSSIPIYAMSRHKPSRQKMRLFGDVFPVAFDPAGGGVTHAARLAVELLHAQGRLSVGDRVVLTTGDHTGLLGGTNTLKLLRVGAGGVPEGMADL